MTDDVIFGEYSESEKEIEQEHQLTWLRMELSRKEDENRDLKTKIKKQAQDISVYQKALGEALLGQNDLPCGSEYRTYIPDGTKGIAVVVRNE